MNSPDGYFSLAALIAAKTTLLLVVAFALSPEDLRLRAVAPFSSGAVL